jgi:hypothetical protein
MRSLLSFRGIEKEAERGNSMTSSRTPLAPLIYLGFFIIAAVITLVTAKETAFAGIFLWIVTLPWNLVLGAILEKIIPGVFAERQKSERPFHRRPRRSQRLVWRPLSFRIPGAARGIARPTRGHES